MDDGSLERYADAIVRDGLLIGPGDVLAVHPEPMQREFAVALTEAGYRAGARYVDVLDDDPRITRARALLAPEDTLDWRPAWQDARMRELVREGAGIIWIAGSEDPQAAGGRASRASRPPRRRSPGPDAVPPRGRAGGRALRRGGLADAGLGRPGLPRAHGRGRAGDARQRPAALRPDRRRRSAERLAAARRGPGGARREAHQLDLRELRLRAPGTDLRLALPAGTSWRGGINDVRGHRITPNIPTEEVFTSPAPAATSGTFRCTRPLAIAGRVIDGHRRRVPARPARAHRGRRRRRSRIPGLLLRP